MHTNMSKEEMLVVIIKLLNEQYMHGDVFFPVEEIIAILNIILTNNLFQFGDCFFLHILEMAMEISLACAIPTLFFA